MERPADYVSVANQRRGSCERLLETCGRVTERRRRGAGDWAADNIKRPPDAARLCGTGVQRYDTPATRALSLRPPLPPRPSPAPAPEVSCDNVSSLTNPRLKWNADPLNTLNFSTHLSRVLGHHEL